MLERIGGVAMVVPEVEAAARNWQEILGAEPAGQDRLEAWSCLRSRYRLGDGWIDFLTPDGEGFVSRSLERRGTAHLWAARATTEDIDLLSASLQSCGVPHERERDELLVCGEAPFGLPVLVERETARPVVGLVDHLYEVTNLVPSAVDVAGHYAVAFGLDPSNFVPIESETYGYKGTLTLFRESQLDRFEVVTPGDAGKTMARFFDRHGPCLYMAFAESDRLEELIDRVAPDGITVVRDGDGPSTVFVHPDLLGGMMLGLSRPGHAWTWSGGYPS